MNNPYIIAEIGVNHECKMDLAKYLIDLAKEGGADAAKFQIYKTDSLVCKNTPGYWNLENEIIETQDNLFKKYDLFGISEYSELAKYCKEKEIDFICTPYDKESVDFVNEYSWIFKIASADITNYPLLKIIAEKRKPVILSTGASNLSEIESAIDCLKKYGCKEIALLHCILNYPADWKNVNLGMINSLSRTFPECVTGYSDHTIPDENMTVLTVAWMRGATILEKHFTHNKTLPGNDHYHSMDVYDLKKLKENIGKIKIMVGMEIKKAIPVEDKARLYARRSIVANRDITKGEILGEKMLICKRPATGISPIFWNIVIKKRAICNIKKDETLQWSMII